MAWNNSCWVHVAQFACCIHIQNVRIWGQIAKCTGAQYNHSIVCWNVNTMNVKVCKIWWAHDNDYKDYCLLGCDAYYFGISFWHFGVACCWLGLHFDPENGVNTFVPNIGTLLPVYMALHHRREYTLQCENNLS